jgi:hypothetical protein
MMRALGSGLGAILAVLAASSSCALLMKSDPIVPRYFSPERAEPDHTPRPLVAGHTGELRLGRIGGSSYLKERMAFRDADHEFGFYEDRRWTERPEVYLERALESALFEDRGLRRAVVATAPTLTVDLTEFEELLGAEPRVRLRVRFVLFSEHEVLAERGFASEKPLPPGPPATRPARVAAALGDLLGDAASRIAEEVRANLLALQAPELPGSVGVPSQGSQPTR